MRVQMVISAFGRWLWHGGNNVLFLLFQTIVKEDFTGTRVPCVGRLVSAEQSAVPVAMGMADGAFPDVPFFKCFGIAFEDASDVVHEADDAVLAPPLVR